MTAVVAMAALFSSGPVCRALAQGNGYHRAPLAIEQILAAPGRPGVVLSPDRRTLAILGSVGTPSIVDFSRPSLTLAGLTIDPATNGLAEVYSIWSNSLTFKDIDTGRETRVQLPKDMRFTGFSWSPDGTRFVLIAQNRDGMTLWGGERDGSCKPLRKGVNSAYGSSTVAWMPDGNSVIARMVVPGRGAPPARSTGPTAPIVLESTGHASSSRTSPGLLKDEYDSSLFEYYLSGQLFRIALPSGEAIPVGMPGIVTEFAVSPDGHFLLVSRLKRPFSYTRTNRSFPIETALWKADGTPVRTLVARPAEDGMDGPDVVPEGPRSFQWRADAPATLAWVEALDGGDPKRAVVHRDRVMVQSAPFEGKSTELARTQGRFAGLAWGSDNFALLSDGDWATRTERRYALAPGRAGQTARLLSTRNTQDLYNDPGEPVMERNPAGKPVMRFTPDRRAIFVTGSGSSARGSFPYLARMPVDGGPEVRLWNARPPYLERFADILDAAGTRILTMRESAKLPPNYVVRDLQHGQVRQITYFRDPAPVFSGVLRRTIHYTRADGVALSGTLYLPPGYDSKRDGPLPTLLWAYPTEYLDAKLANQAVGEDNRFQRPFGASPLFMVTQGYAVFDHPGMPIIGINGAPPNDSYNRQLIANAEAAIAALVKLGVSDPGRMAIGGHSYGAFMTASLLAQTDLFRAGIAMSGAYNRTLTPFGFQGEQRSYWQAPRTYTDMAPFTHADRIKTPLLLIHGAADDNSGTFPLQSERMFAAVNGNGGTVRYVSLPGEPHVYRAIESIGEVMWQMTDWLDRYVKPIKR